MTKKVGIFVDVQNLWYCVSYKFGTGKKVDYDKLYEYAKNLGDIWVARAYNIETSSDSESFIHALGVAGFEVVLKKPKIFQNDSGGKKYKGDLDMLIAVDIFRMFNTLNIIILVTADGDFKPLVSFAKEKNIKVIVIGSNISYELKTTANEWFEIDESMLLEK